MTTPLIPYLPPGTLKNPRDWHWESAPCNTQKMDIYFVNISYTLHTDMFIISIYMCVQDLPYLVSCIINWACKASKSMYDLHGRTNCSLFIQRYWDNMRLVVKQLQNVTITGWTNLRSCLSVRNIYEIVELLLRYVIITHKNSISLLCIVSETIIWVDMCDIKKSKYYLGL